VIALIRYSGSGVFRSQRWVAPVLCFVTIEAIMDANTGSVLPTYAASAAVLLFIATWLTIVVANNEDPVQREVTMVVAGSQAKVRVANLLTAYLAAVFLGLVSLIGPPLASSQGVTAHDLAAGAVAQAVTSLAGVVLGTLCSRPIIRRTAWALLIAVVLDLADVVVPNGPPTRQILVLFDKAHPSQLALDLMLVAIETMAIGAVVLMASVRLARVRS
jgi:hypothetical protein